MIDELRRLASGLLVRLAIKVWPAKRAADVPVLHSFYELTGAMLEEARVSWEARQ